MNIPEPSENTKMVLLLCCPFDKPGVKTLGPAEYSCLARALFARGLTPRDLPGAPLPELAAEAGLDAARLGALLSRGGSLGFALEKWLRAGLWVVSRGDEAYPARLREHLRDQSPTFLFGAGDPSLLKRGGLAMVGSRDVDERGRAFAAHAARLCAESLMPVVSGCARGVDAVSMAEAMRHGGTAVGFVAESLLKKSVSPDYRRGIAEGQALLLSPYLPEAPFSVGAAMGRNKLIYAQADFALVVCSDIKGGTWSGATEELRREKGRPVFVRAEAGCPPGNARLLELGGIPWPETPTGADLRALLEKSASIRPPAQASVPMGQSSLLEDAAPLAETARQPGRITPPVPEKAEARAPLAKSPEEANAEAAPGPESGRENGSLPEAKDHALAIYRCALSHVLELLEEPMALEGIAERLDIEKKQMKKWLDRAEAEKLVEKTRRPVRYKRALSQGLLS